MMFFGQRWEAEFGSHQLATDEDGTLVYGQAAEGGERLTFRLQIRPLPPFAAQQVVDEPVQAITMAFRFRHLWTADTYFEHWHLRRRDGWYEIAEWLRLKRAVLISGPNPYPGSRLAHFAGRGFPR